MTETVGCTGKPQRAGGWWETGASKVLLNITPESQARTRILVIRQ